jgi:hypothetical protein
MDRNIRALVRALQTCLTPDLLSPAWRQRANGPLSGHCYVASEAAWHMLGGPSSGWSPKVARIGDITHWWLGNGTTVLDVTAGQFVDAVDYSKGRGCGFLTKQPSKRASELMSRARLVLDPKT